MDSKCLFLVLGVLLFLNLQPVNGNGDSSYQFFQLISEDGTCLQILYNRGAFAPCKNNASGDFTPNTLFLLDVPDGGELNIQVFGTGNCLDREHCHSSTSNLRYSDCSHCGAIHWSINQDGSVREDTGLNCIYKDSNGDAAVHHCTDGFMKFQRSFFGDHFILKSVRSGDCLAGGSFTDCKSAPSWYTNGPPGNYKITVYNSPGTCLDRVSCHQSTSDARLFECSHCGAIHWSIFNYKVGEDGLQNCISRDGNRAVIIHCSDGYEALHTVIIPNSTYIIDWTMDNTIPQLLLPFANPEPNEYLQEDLSLHLCGARLFKFLFQGVELCELEVVHYIPNIFPSGQARVQYMVTHLQTKITYSKLSIADIMGKITTDFSLISRYNIRYGIADGSHVSNHDGLLSSFVTNPTATPVLDYTPFTIDQLMKGFQRRNTQYIESFYPGQSNGHQWYAEFYDGPIVQALYWLRSSNDVPINAGTYDIPGTM